MFDRQEVRPFTDKQIALVIGRGFREQGFERLTYVRFSNRPVRENGSLLRCRSRCCAS